MFTDVLSHAYLHQKLCDDLIGDTAIFEKAGCATAPDFWLHFKISNIEFPVSIESLLSPNITRGPESDWPKLAAAVRHYRLENESDTEVTSGENSEIIYTMQRIQLHLDTVLQRITSRLFILGIRGIAIIPPKLLWVIPDSSSHHPNPPKPPKPQCQNSPHHFSQLLFKHGWLW